MGSRRSRSKPAVRWIEMKPWYPGYWVSEAGDFYSERRGMRLTINTDKDDYLITHMRDLNGKDKNVRVHRVVCWHFNGPYPRDGRAYGAYFIDGNKHNTHYTNLEWRPRPGVRRQPGEPKPNGNRRRKQEGNPPDKQRYDFDSIAKLFPGR